MEYHVISLNETPQIKNTLAQWFSQKWGIPESAYLKSMNDCLKNKSAVPRWYYVLDGGKIIASLGVIDNDFHQRTDLSPNICAVYVQEEYRRLGIAGKMLDFACNDMKNFKVNTLYLSTDHIGFYEKYGWEFFCMVQGDGESTMSRMYKHTLKR